MFNDMMHYTTSDASKYKRNNNYCVKGYSDKNGKKRTKDAKKLQLLEIVRITLP